MPREPIEMNSRNDSSAESHVYANLMADVSAARRENSVTTLSLKTINNEWTNSTLDFGTEIDLYGKKSASDYPFAPLDIASAGVIAGVELNKEEAQSISAKGTIAGDKDTPNSATEPAREQVNLGQLANINEALWGESPASAQKDILQDFAQTGSAGVEQGRLGDCQFESALASIASSHQGQGLISKMIKQEPDGSYAVTFPGDPQKTIHVTKNEAFDDKYQNSATWANVLEAAYHKLRPDEVGNAPRANPFPILTGSPEGMLPIFNGEQNWRTASGRAEEREVVPTLTQLGHQFLSGQSDSNETIPNIQTLLQNQLASGDPVTAGDAVQNSPLEVDHQYSVLDIANGRVTVRNPWGCQDPTNCYEAEDGFDNKNKPAVGQTIRGVTNIGGGELTMSINTFVQDFKEIEVAQIQ